MSEQKTRPADMPKVAPGTRVKYEYGRWGVESHRTVVTYDEQYATRSWASEPRFGTVVTDAEFSGAPANHPWGVPSNASAVRWDDHPQVTWVRSACLDVIGFAQKEAQQFELFAGTA